MDPKIDFKKALASYKAPRGDFEIIEVPDLQYLMVDGHGDPNSSPAFQEAIQSLYPVAYKLKFASKSELGRDYVVPPLEGLWWAEDMSSFTTERDKSNWDWTLMVMTPEWIDETMFHSAIQLVASKNPPDRLGDLRLAGLSEGTCVQTLHVGSFDDEAPVLEAMHQDFIPNSGLTLTGKHHEIYLSDFRRVEPARQRTILRQPVVSVS